MGTSGKLFSWVGISCGWLSLQSTARLLNKQYSKTFHLTQILNEIGCRLFMSVTRKAQIAFLFRQVRW